MMRPCGIRVVPSQAGSGGPANDFTRRNATFMTWNLMRMARLLRDAGGSPAHGNQRGERDAGCRFDHPNPDYPRPGGAGIASPAGRGKMPSVSRVLSAAPAVDPRGDVWKGKKDQN
jgi:hypothetical protein